jgi:hypothetical protein
VARDREVIFMGICVLIASTAHAALDQEVADEEREKMEYFDSIKDSLLQIKSSIWDNIQNKVAVFLSGIQLTVFKVTVLYVNIHN